MMADLNPKTLVWWQLGTAVWLQLEWLSGSHEESSWDI